MTPEQQWDWVENHAAFLGATPGQIQKWRERGRVSDRWQVKLMKQAKLNRARIDPSNLDRAPVRRNGK